MSEGLDETWWGTLMPRTLKLVAGLQFDCTELRQRELADCVYTAGQDTVRRRRMSKTGAWCIRGRTAERDGEQKTLGCPRAMPVRVSTASESCPGGKTARVPWGQTSAAGSNQGVWREEEGAETKGRGGGAYCGAL